MISINKWHYSLKPKVQYSVAVTTTNTKINTDILIKLYVNRNSKYPNNFSNKYTPKFSRIFKYQKVSFKNKNMMKPKHRQPSNRNLKFAVKRIYRAHKW